MKMKIKDLFKKRDSLYNYLLKNREVFVFMGDILFDDIDNPYYNIYGELYHNNRWDKSQLVIKVDNCTEDEHFILQNHNLRNLDYVLTPLKIEALNNIVAHLLSRKGFYHKQILWALYNAQEDDMEKEVIKEKEEDIFQFCEDFRRIEELKNELKRKREQELFQFLNPFFLFAIRELGKYIEEDYYATERWALDDTKLCDICHSKYRINRGKIKYLPNSSERYVTRISNEDAIEIIEDLLPLLLKKSPQKNKELKDISLILSKIKEV